MGFHQDVWEMEQDTAADRSWYRWVDAASKLLGLSECMDGDEQADGYSLDSAYDAWRAGKTPAEYVAGWRPDWTRR